ncbi:hypothetical protein N7463_001676 [Penicillium fimorum]|uniref:NAD(P)-binding domain-containing protein n=1 Tax=Penicillium fimorum TaxID=1882269 RepID=A0A9W9XXL5_9EURO|nr:hypothetical protein N7463_001676 [Penicillium fimorum]
MPTYAILGATGNCGTALIDNLLQTEDAKVNAYCRSMTKLIQKVPTITDNNIYDIDLLAECIRDTRAIFHVVTTNDNIPGCHVGLDTAKSIISAIEKLKVHGQLGAIPKILLLSSGTIDDHLSRHMPW